MKYVHLVTASDEYDQSPGFRLQGLPEIDGYAVERTDGILIAHDLLEHQNGVGNIGTVWDELEALGGIWHVRGRHGDLMTPSYHSPQVNIASDVTRMFPDWVRETRRRVPVTYASDYDDDFREIIDIARRDIPKEWDADDGYSVNAREEYLAETLARMRIGFRKAHRRFGGGYKGYSMFSAVKREVERAVRFIDFEGQEFILGYAERECVIREVETVW